MVTVEQFKEICELMVKEIDRKRQLFHIKSGIKVEAVAFPYQPSPVIYLWDSLTHDNFPTFYESPQPR